MTQFPTDAGSGSTTKQAKDQVREKTEVAREKAQGAAQHARSRFRDQVDQRSTQAGERLSGTAADVRSVAEELRRQGKDTPAWLAEQAAGQADHVADYLKGASGERILRDVENLARGKPWTVAAGGLVVGFAASRFLKASSSRRYQAAQTSSPTGYQQAPPQGGRHLAAEPTAPVADVPMVGIDDPAAPSVTTPAPTGVVPTDPERRAPKAE